MMVFGASICVSDPRRFRSVAKSASLRARSVTAVAEASVSTSARHIWKPMGSRLKLSHSRATTASSVPGSRRSISMAS